MNTQPLDLPTINKPVATGVVKNQCFRHGLLCSTLMMFAIAHHAIASETTLVDAQLPGIFVTAFFDGAASPDVSADGRWVTFSTSITDLINGPFAEQVIVHDQRTGSTVIASESSTGQRGNGASQNAVISSDGNTVVFESEASNLVTNDTNGVSDIFVFNVSTGDLQLISRTNTGQLGDDRSEEPAISPNGRFVVYQSIARNIAGPDNDSKFDVFFHDRVTGLTEKITPDDSGSQASVDAFGRFVAFSSVSRFLDNDHPFGSQDIFVHDRFTGSVDRISVSSSGATANALSSNPRISASGEWIVFQSLADNLVSGDTNGVSDVFRHNRLTGVTEIVSLASNGGRNNDISTRPDISGTGRYVSFLSSGGLVTHDDNNTTDIYVRDMDLGLTTRESERTPEQTGGGRVGEASISGDGRHIVFTTTSSLDDEDTDLESDVYHRNRGGECDVDDSRNQFVLSDNRWQLIALPCQPPRGTTIVGMFNDDISGNYGQDWVVFTFDPTLPVPNYTDPGRFWTPSTGIGFWIIQDTGSSVTLDLPFTSRGPGGSYRNSPNCTSDVGCRHLSLSGAPHPPDASGDPTEVLWNLLGNPQLGTEHPVAINDLRVTTSTGPCTANSAGCTLPEAVAPEFNVLANILFTYNGSTYDTIDAGDALLPWQGFWAGELLDAVGNKPVLVMPE